MVLGPTEIEKDILKEGANSQEYMRTQDYTEKWFRIFENLKYAFQTKNSVVVYATSGTGAMEAAVTNFLSSDDKVLYINGGSFGKRWGDICKKHNIETFEIPVEFGKSPNIDDVKKYMEQNSDVKALFATLNETSSGALTDIEAIGELLKNYPDILFIVDCISGLLSEEFLQDIWGVDVAVSASQKAFALPPGLSFLSASKKALDRAEKSNLRNFYFDIFDYVNNANRGQTPFTPAVGIVNQLDKRLQKIKNEGLENFRNRYKKNTLYLREGLKNLGFNVLAESPANCVTAVYTKDLDAYKIVQIMREKYNIEIAPSGGELKHKLFRIGNFGNIQIKNIKFFLKCLNKVLKDL